ncbi:hypothetical protein CLV40_102303 [Actinokineospora auranticolor]|uniref:Uncharacterized protein n=1 Tax=Actinokineospora auranticolor TaxID=155976 RepID=A0A2S6GYS9_9PSEU|nr:hypothetical protein CLV40_102303 [Actinokineospora auranticolor]
MLCGSAEPEPTRAADSASQRPVTIRATVCAARIALSGSLIR